MCTSRIINEDIKAAKRFDQLCEDHRSSVGERNVTRDRQHAARRASVQATLRLAKPVGIACDDADRCPGLKKLLCNCKANPGTCAGDQRDPVLNL